MAVTMTLGDHEFAPAPQLNISKNWVKRGDGANISLVTQYTLQGQLFCGLATQCNTGIVNLIEKQVEMEAAIGGCPSCQRFYLECGPENSGTVMIDTRVNIVSVDYSPTTNNWVQTIDYSIVLESNDISGQECLTPCLSSVNEQWSLSRVEDSSYFYIDPSGEECSGLEGNHVFELTHDVSATAVECCVSGEEGITAVPGWEIARDWVMDNIGLDTDFIEMSGTIGLGLDPSGIGSGLDPSGMWEDLTRFNSYNHTRSSIVDKTGGSYSVNERWVIADFRGKPPARESFTVDIDRSEDSPFTLVSVRGNIVGMESADWANYSIGVGNSKYERALEYWNWLNENNLCYCRANRINTWGECELNGDPLTETVSHNPADGVISYVCSFNDRPGKLITGARRESITINDSYPTPVFAEFPIIGRAAGPIIQDMGTVTRRTRSVSIDISYGKQCIPNISGEDCTTKVNSLTLSPSEPVRELLCCIEQDLEANWDIVLKTADTGSWNPFTGQYTRNVEWTFQDCSGIVDTGFC